jgi:hypothetical protein
MIGIDAVAMMSFSRMMCGVFLVEVMLLFASCWLAMHGSFFGAVV